MDSSNMSLDVCPTSFYTDFVAPEKEPLVMEERPESKSLDGYLELKREQKFQAALDLQCRLDACAATGKDDFPEFSVRNSAPPAPVRQSRPDRRTRFEKFRAGKLRRSPTVTSKKSKDLEELRKRSAPTLEKIELRYSDQKTVAPLRKKKSAPTSKPKARTVKSPKGGRPAAAKAQTKTRSKLSTPTRTGNKPRMSDRMSKTMMTKTNKTRSRSRLTSPVRTTKKKTLKSKTLPKAMLKRGKSSKGKGKTRMKEPVMI
jgi:hypothetical protein